MRARELVFRIVNVERAIARNEKLQRFPALGLFVRVRSAACRLPLSVSGIFCRLTVMIACGIFAGSLRAAAALDAKEGDFVIHDFHFLSGETLPLLRLHYRTLGQPVRDARGRVSNAVLMLHATGADDQQFLQARFGDALFEPGGLLDTHKYFIILPDGIGHGKSSKPSDGLRAIFPQYDYDDMVAAQYALV